jgi:hypothetical protein
MFRLGETESAVHQPCKPSPQIDVFALDFLCIGLANPMLFSVDVPLVGPPPIRVVSRNAKRFQERLQLEKNSILAAPEDVG